MAADSVDKIDLTQPRAFKKELDPGVTEEIVLHPMTHEPVVVNRKNGRFVKQKKTMPRTEDVTRLLRNLLLQAEAGPDGKMSKSAKHRLRVMFDNIFTIASMSPEQPVFDKLGNLVMVDGKPLTVKDAKSAMASVKAFEALMLRAYGVPSKSEEEIDALKTQGVKIVVITPPEFMNKQVTEEAPKPALKPSFIEGEFVENK